MANQRLNVAFWDYDRTRALRDGKVKIADADAMFHTAPFVIPIFEGVVRGQFNVGELGMTFYLRTFQSGKSPFVAIPVFLNRAFRHSAIYINKASGIQKPEDLNGKRIGELALYSHDAGIIPKGILMDEFGFKPESCQWIIGGLDWPMHPIDFVPMTHPADVEVSHIPKGKELGAMLEAGEIDALISADNPKCILDDSPKVCRLFPNYPEIEREYYKRTGIFPIMHTVVIRRDLLQENLSLAKNVYQAFTDAKAEALKNIEHQLIFNSAGTMVPWYSSLINEDRALLGDDWWPYGIEANRKAIELVLRYHYEQGITDRLFKIEDIFAPVVVDTE